MSTSQKQAFENIENQNDLPQWQKDLIEERVAEFQKHPENIIEWSQVVEAFDAEDKSKENG